MTESTDKSVIIAIRIGPKAAHQVVVGDVAGLGRNGTGKGRRRNFDERRRGGGLRVELYDEAMLVAIIVRPEPRGLVEVIDAEQILQGVVTFGGEPAGSSIGD
jgi:hypothetical protein